MRHLELETKKEKETDTMKYKYKGTMCYLETKTSPVTIYLSEDCSIDVLQRKCPVPEAWIFNRCKLLIPVKVQQRTHKSSVTRLTEDIIGKQRKRRKARFKVAWF